MTMSQIRTIAPTDERPLSERPDLPNWSENYCLQAYDPATEIGFWLHSGLPVYDFDLWHDITIVYLPGGEEVLIAKGFGARTTDVDVPGSMLTGDYIEETGEWAWRFHGAGMRCRQEDLDRAAAVDGPVEPLEFELRFRGLSEVWDLKKEVAGQVWTNAHWEQPCLTTGWVQFAGERHAFDGTGIRDHSRGSRDFVYMGPHFWLHGQFPSGRAFGLLHIEPSSGQPRPLSSAYVVTDGRLEDAKVISLPDDRTLSAPFEIVIETAAGEQRIQGELLHNMPFTVEYPNEILFGYRAGRPQHRLDEGQVRWSWAGETGYGLGERTDVIGSDGTPERR